MANILIDGGLDSWDSATSLTYWTESATGASTVNRDATQGAEGAYCARLDVDGSNSYVCISQTFKLVPYRRYCLSFWYRNSAAGKTLNVDFYENAGQSRSLNGKGVWGPLGLYMDIPNSLTGQRIWIEFVNEEFASFTMSFKRGSAASSSIWIDDVKLESRDGCGFMLENQFDGSTVTAGTEATNFPASNLKHRWHKRTWRSTQVAATEWVKANRGTGYYAPVDIFLERSNNLTAAATAKIQAAAADAWTTIPLDIGVTVKNDILCAVFAGKNRGEILVDGGLNVWTTATDLANWAESLSGTSTVNREGTEKVEGAYSCRLDVDGSNSSVYINQNPTLVPGRRYRLSVRYKHSTTGKTSYFRFYDSGSNVYLKEDGTWEAGYLLVLPNATSWTTFTVEFTAHASYSNYILLLGRGNATSASCYFDSVSLCAAEPPWYQWWRHTLYDTANPDGYLEEGRLYLGPIFEPSRGILAGSGSPQEQDPSLISESENGQISTIGRDHFRIIALQFQGLSQADYDTLTAHFATVGTARDFWFCRDLGDPWHETYYVRYAQPPTWTRRYLDYYDATIVLEELR